MRRVAKVLLGIATAALIAAGPLAPAGGAATPLALPSASSCKQATNIEAIVDDSISMEFTDAGRLRVQAMNLLIDTLGKSTQLGAVEFGSAGYENNPPAADTLFPPLPVGPNAPAMRTALDQKIHADNGATDYNGAFAQADLDNPNADARIFLTDGGHDVDTYNEAHLVHNVPTYVIGFGGITAPEDQARLKKIAADTGGSYFPLDDSSQLQSVMNSIGAALTCQTPPRLFSDELGKGQSKLHSVSIGAATKSIQITLTWASPLDKFKISGLRLTGPKGLIAVASRPKAKKPAKLKVSKTVSTTFTVLKVSHLRKGNLHFAVKATAIGSGAPKVTLTTQVGQSSHR
jgi:von Willebrand factor type A domain